MVIVQHRVALLKNPERLLQKPAYFSNYELPLPFLLGNSIFKSTESLLIILVPHPKIFLSSVS